MPTPPPRAIRQYHGMPYGPVAGWRDDEGVWAQDVDGRTVVVRAPHQTPQPQGDAMLRDGVDI